MVRGAAADVEDAEVDAISSGVDAPAEGLFKRVDLAGMDVPPAVLSRPGCVDADEEPDAADAVAEGAGGLSREATSLRFRFEPLVADDEDTEVDAAPAGEGNAPAPPAADSCDDTRTCERSSSPAASSSSWCTCSAPASPVLLRLEADEEEADEEADEDD